MAAQIAFDAASRAAARARAGRGTFHTAFGPLDAPPPFSIAAPDTAWVEPDGTTWLAWGEAAVLESDRAEDAPALADRARAMLADVTGPGAAIARWFGGQAFSRSETPLGGPCPAARYTLPAAIMRWTPAGAEAAVIHAGAPDEHADAALADLWDALLARTARAAAPAPWPAVLASREDADGWREGVESALAAIGAGAADKLVLARPVRLTADRPWDAWGVFAALAAAAPGTHRFFFGGEGPGPAFLGASPERLFAEAEGLVHVDCLAGTAPRGHDAAEDDAIGEALLSSDKDRREHQWVVQAVREAIAPHTASLPPETAPALMRLASLQHLHTPITAPIKPERTLGDMIAALHPTPAVGGYPRLAALSLIPRLEPAARGWYAAPVGWIAEDASCFAVAIRSAYLDGCEAAVMAGAGLVPGSTPGGEWDETARKARPLVRLLTEGPA